MRMVFDDERLERLAMDLSFDMGLDRGVVKAFRMAVQAIDAGVDERIFYARPGWRFEKLVGNYKGKCSIRLNKQWRLILEIRTDESGKLVAIISIVDYH